MSKNEVEGIDLGTVRLIERVIALKRDSGQKLKVPNCLGNRFY